MYDDVAGPDNAGAHGRAPRGDGYANAVHRADRLGSGHADGAHHASANARESWTRGDVSEHGVR